LLKLSKLGLCILPIINDFQQTLCVPSAYTSAEHEFECIQNDIPCILINLDLNSGAVITIA